MFRNKTMKKEFKKIKLNIGILIFIKKYFNIIK
jgi:hypothetical protein